MLAAIATATGCLIGIRVERLETVRLAGLPERLFTPDMSATHIRYVTQSPVQASDCWREGGKGGGGGCIEEMDSCCNAEQLPLTDHSYVRVWVISSKACKHNACCCLHRVADVISFLAKQTSEAKAFVNIYNNICQAKLVWHSGLSPNGW